MKLLCIPENHPIAPALTRLFETFHSEAFAAVRPLYHFKPRTYADEICGFYELVKSLEGETKAQASVNNLVDRLCNAEDMRRLYELLIAEEHESWRDYLSPAIRMFPRGAPAALISILRLTHSDHKGIFEVSDDPDDQHVEDFLDEVLTSADGDGLMYAHFMLSHFRKHGVMRKAQERYMNNQELYVTYEGERYRVTGASRLGDLMLSRDFTTALRYSKRVRFNRKKMSDWGATP